MQDSKNKRLSVSVIIPTYNRAEMTSTAVESLLSQTRIPDEIIIVDDGSTDGTDRLLSQYGPPVIVIRQPNRGRSAARNEGLRAASKDAVIFLDSDDLMMPRSIERCVQVLEEHPEVDIVYTDAYILDDAGKRTGRYSKVLSGPRPSGMILGELARRCFISISSMIRRSSLGEIAFEEGMECAEDYDFWRRLAAKCHFHYLDEPLMCYRFHDMTTLATKLLEVLESELVLQRRIFAMPEFQALPRRERARAFCAHGVKNTMLGKMDVARQYFRLAVRTAPFYPLGYTLALLSLLGTRTLQRVILRRRQVAGNRLGYQAGQRALSQAERASRSRAVRKVHSPGSGARNASPRPVKVLIVGQTPPPHGGKPIMIERLVRSHLPGVQLLHARIGFASATSDLSSFRWWKTFQLFAWIARIMYRRIVHGVNILYYPPGGPNRMPMYRDWAILLSTRWMFAKTIFHFHAGGVTELYDRLPGWQRWLFRRAYLHPDAAIRLSELTPEDGRHLDSRREYVIPNGIEDPCPGLCLPRPAAAGQPLRVLFVGMLCESKGLLVLIEACGQLAARGIPFRLEVMGQWQSEEFAARAQTRVAQLNLESHVRFLGVLTGGQKFAAYEESDVFCFPTFFECEAFPVVLLEAMAFGLPVVATRWRGIPSLVEDGETGILVEPHDAEAIADRLACLAEDVELRQRLGRAGREQFEREYTWATCAERMRQMFLDVAGVPPAEQKDAMEEARAVHSVEALATADVP